MELSNCEKTSFGQVVNRIPPSSVKPTKRETFSGSKECSPRAKRKKHSFLNTRPMDLDPLFRKMDPSDPKVAHRIAQRRKAIAKGKNTAGYAEYIRQVPKEKRRPRCLETPSTPDPTVEMSNGRFNGLVKAWRIALHKYDPPELLNTFNDETSGQNEVGIATMETGQEFSTPIKVRQLKDAVEKGLLVDLVPGGQEESPISLLSGSPRDRFENSIGGFGIDDDDDDLL